MAHLDTVHGHVVQPGVDVWRMCSTVGDMKNDLHRKRMSEAISRPTAILTQLLKAAGPTICQCSDPLCDQWHAQAGWQPYRITETNDKTPLTFT